MLVVISVPSYVTGSQRYYFSFLTSLEGFVTDGKFNSLMTKGSQRPVSIIQLIMDAKKEANSISFHWIERYLRPKHVGKCMTIDGISFVGRGTPSCNLSETGVCFNS